MTTPPSPPPQPQASASNKQALPRLELALQTQPGVQPDAASQTQAALSLASEAAERAKGFGRVIAFLAFAAALYLPFLGGYPPFQAAAEVAAIVLGLVGAWFAWYVVTHPDSYATALRFFGVMTVIAALPIVLHFGVFSPAAMLLTLGIAYFGLADDPWVAFGVPALATLMYFSLAALITLEVLPDHSFFPSTQASFWARGYMAFVVPTVQAVTLAQARFSRRATRRAIQQAHAATRLARARQEQLKEAHHDLERALAHDAPLPLVTQKVGPYALAEHLGRGAMGQVYAALDERNQRQVAIKLLSADLQSDPMLEKRFLREGEHAAKIDSSHVAKVFEYGKSPAGKPFIAMELLRGHDLAWYLRRNETLPLAHVDLLLQHVAAGLDAAHESGIIHRDLKPQNIFCCEPQSEESAAESSWKLLDFGVSRFVERQGTLTQQGIVGTPSYMSPEQAQGKDVAATGDVFSMASVAYRCLTGRRAFAGKDMPATLFEIVYRAPIRPTALHPALPADVDLAFAIAFAKSPDDRFASAGEFAEVFHRACKGELQEPERVRAAQLLSSVPWAEPPSVRWEKA